MKLSTLHFQTNLKFCENIWFPHNVGRDLSFLAHGVRLSTRLPIGIANRSINSLDCKGWVVTCDARGVDHRFSFVVLVVWNKRLQELEFRKWINPYFLFWDPNNQPITFRSKDGKSFLKKFPVLFKANPHHFFSGVNSTNVYPY